MAGRADRDGKQPGLVSSDAIGYYAFQFRGFKIKAGNSTDLQDAKVIISTGKVYWNALANNDWNAAALKNDGTRYSRPAL
ncbi:hypothetical protein [Achromobacter sp. UMC46]|uniref:hypothetical protein n=1 Tax=Achromobacter sp. UMC46 TaxID=1862319 RepID=UPI001600A4D1|nr:hypothetical protein [Achromobacter sp. UMC46]MBB1592619.1 hypothetical protein [Achromobacter sp. UMC46]